ncbi:MAG: hypothetical protein M1825_003381 [Sarcosagium campestre]|nr:MAG: hypothetical protein M1825_003381 [Sarcosagium campestre]
MFVAPVIYTIFLRQMAWDFTLGFAKIFWSIPKSTSLPPSILPFHISVLFRVTAAGFMLSMIWEVSNLCFSVFVAQVPLKATNPLTADSKDPNGTLLAGLKAKKQLPRCFAFWELLYISHNVPLRRKSFFEDIDRKGGALWSQILGACLEVVYSLNTRINDDLNPPPPEASAPPQKPQLVSVNTLPRITTPLKQDAIFAASPPSSRTEKFGHVIGSFAKSQGDAPPRNRRASSSPQLRKLIGYGVDATLSSAQKQALTQGNLGNIFNSYLLRFLRSPAGFPFRQTLRRRATAVALGSPDGDKETIIAAVHSITQLSICSLVEDDYGKVQKDIADIIRLFTTTIENLTRFRNLAKPGWTDVHTKGDAAIRDSFEEIDQLRAVFREALGSLLVGFGSYADVLGLSLRDVRLAKAAASAPAKPSGAEGK